MSVSISIVDGAIEPSESAAERRHAPAGEDAWGAVIVFDGVVRGTEEGRRLAALEYEHYEPMAGEQLRALAEDVVKKFGLSGLRCVHSRGRVGVGECSMRVTVWSAHRKEGLLAMGEFIDRLKKDVPIWKKVVWARGD